MRGTFVDQGGLFCTSHRRRGPANHPLRKIRELVRDVLGELTCSLGRLSTSEGPWLPRPSAADRRGICQVHEQTSEPSGG